MGLTESSIYLDSCLAIYLIEESLSFVGQINLLREFLEALPLGIAVRLASP